MSEDIRDQLQKIVGDGKIITKAVVLAETVDADMVHRLSLYVSEGTALWDVVGMLKVVGDDLSATFSAQAYEEYEGDDD